MRLLRVLVSILVLATAFAGCADLRGNLEAEPEPEFREVLPWTTTNCQFAVAIIAINTDEIGARVPEGFRVLSIPEIPNFPVPADPRGDGNLGIELFSCESGTGLNATANITPMVYGSVFSFVEPPADKRDENATYHFLKWDVLIPDDARRGLLASERVPALPGNVTFSRFQDVGPLTAVQGIMQMGEDEYVFDGGGQPQGTDALAAVSFVEFTDVGNGEFVVWRTNMTAQSVQAGSGFVDLSGASWVRQVVGGARPQAYYLTGVASFDDGTIALPYRE